MNYRSRIAALGLLLLLPFGALEARLVWVQGICAAPSRDPDRTVVRREVIRPSRGGIFDVKGVCLARDERSFDLAIVLRDLKLADRALEDLSLLLGRPREEVAAFRSDPDALTKGLTGRIARKARALVALWRSQPLSDEVEASLAAVLGLDKDEIAVKIADLEERLLQHASERDPEIELDRLEGARAAPRTLLTGLDFDRVKEIDLAAERFPGVVVQESVRRVYPRGRVAGALVGYVGRFRRIQGEDEYEARERQGYFRNAFDVPFDRDEEYQELEESEAFRQEWVGRMGVERSHQDDLRGAYGRMLIEKDRHTGATRVLRMIRSRPGKDLRLTIDVHVQESVEAVLDTCFRQTGHACAAVVLDPRDGSIVAMASVPSYDPRDFLPPDSRVRAKQYTDPEAAKDKPLIDRALMGTYPSGSIFKIVTTIAGIEEGQLTPDTWYECEGRYHETPPYFQCDVYPGRHGRMDLEQAIAHSCNIFFFHVGEGVGVDALARWGSRLGLGRPTGVDLPYERAGDLPTREWLQANRRGRWYPNDTLNLSIGQGVLTVTPLQIAVLLSFVANGGYVVRPHISADVAPSRTQVSLSPGTLERLRQGLWAVVHDPGGTACQTGLARFHVAGKTSTAEVHSLDPTLKEPHAWFAGYAPAEDPKFAFAVLVEHGGHGARVAAPIAEKILEVLMPAPEDAGKK